MTHRKEADKIITNHILWAMGAGLVPIPLFDIAAITAIQMDMLKQLSALYGVNYSQSGGKAFISTLTASTLATLGASLVKAIPGLGSVIGAVSMPILAGASTYAVGQIVTAHFEADGDLSDIDMEWAKIAYQEAFVEGKRVAADLEQEQGETSKDLFKSLEKLGKLREKGFITEEEFEAQKQKLLDRL